MPETISHLKGNSKASKEKTSRTKHRLRLSNNARTKMKSENQVRERMKHIFELFEREGRKSDLTDMIMVAVMRELQWVLYDKQEANDHFG